MNALVAEVSQGVLHGIFLLELDNARLASVVDLHICEQHSPRFSPQVLLCSGVKEHGARFIAQLRMLALRSCQLHRAGKSSTTIRKSVLCRLLSVFRSTPFAACTRSREPSSSRPSSANAFQSNREIKMNTRPQQNNQACYTHLQ